MDTTQVRYIFLDRDGVLNRKPPEGSYVTEWPLFQWAPGAREAVVRMKGAGFTLIVVTNQRGVALGLYTAAQLEGIHSKMQQDLAQHGVQVDAIYYCPHDRNVCRCRKPDVGMFEQAFQRFPEANVWNSVFIGDSLTDMQAGQRLGMKTIFIEAEEDEREELIAAAKVANAVAGSLLEAVENCLIPSKV
jgi:D-glycero-D-manno-heptose 1,7-bisphosphate phosphatase